MPPVLGLRSPPVAQPKDAPTSDDPCADDPSQCGGLPPIGPFQGPPIIYTGGGGGSTAVSVTVPVTVQPTPIAITVPTQGITNAVLSGIDAGTNDSNKAVAALAGELASNLGGLAGALNTFVDNATGSITGAVTNAIEQAVNPQTLILAALRGDILNLGSQIGTVEGGIVTPILESVAQLSSTFGVGLSAISVGLDKDLASINATLENFLPSQTTALNQIAHWIEILTGGFPGWGSSKIDLGGLINIGVDLKKVGDVLAGWSVFGQDTSYHPSEKIGAACDLTRFNAIIQEFQNFPASLPQPFRWIWDLARAVWAELVSLVPQLEKYLENGEQIANQGCPLQPLDPSFVAEMVRRGILDKTSAQHEMAIQGLSPSRIQAVFDGQTYQVQPNEAYEQFYRGVIDANTLSSILKANGYTEAQIAASQNTQAALLDFNNLATAFIRGTITGDEINKALEVQRFSDAQIQLLKTNLLRPPRPEEVMMADAKQTVGGAVSIPYLTGLFNVPEWYSDAGGKNGWNSATIQANWAAHWNMLGPGEWIQLYFRGNRNAFELQKGLDAALIPRTLQDDLVDANRPLIPFRTVPAMLRGGILTLDRARQILGQHGFASGDIETLLAYASIGSKSTKSTAAASSHNVSLATAKTLYTDGVVDKSQYETILAAHGLDAEAVSLEMDLTDLGDQIKARQQTGMDVVNEYLAGMLTHDQAVQELAVSGMTVAEQAKYVRQLRSSASSKNKLPTEAELRSMAVKGVIQVPQYHDTLVLAGYSEQWAQAFTDLHFPNGGVPVAAPAAAPPVP